MTVWIVLEGPSDRELISALLPPRLESLVRLVPTGGLSNLASVARTLLVKHKEPVALIADTDSLDAGVINERYTTLQQLLRDVAGGTPFTVVLAIPELEDVFFEATESLARIFPNIDLSSHLMFYKTQPKHALAFLFKSGGGPKNLTALLNELTEDDTQKIRQAPPLRDLISFIERVATVKMADQP
jgi:hypothetical protein